MARFTVDDCQKNIQNVYKLTLVAITRVSQIENGSTVKLDNSENDKPAVLALREIAAGEITSDILNNNMM